MRVFTSFFFLLFLTSTYAQNVGINATGVAPDGSALLDISGTNGGLLIPRMTTGQRNAIAAPATSLIIFNTTDQQFEYFDGTSWVALISGAGTLDDAYDFGGAGLGNTIVADSGPVFVTGNDGIVSTGTGGTTGASIPTGSGVRMVWNPSRRAFRVGEIQGTEWDPVNVGLGSNAWGLNTEASGGRSTAWGRGTIASGLNATSWGFNTISSNAHTTAWGSVTEAAAFGATAWGLSTISSGARATSWGRMTEASGQRSTAWGSSTLASGLGSTAWGETTLASSSNATAWGFNTSALSFASTAWGEGNIASQVNATAWGLNSEASGQRSTAWGGDTEGQGVESTAWGRSTLASSAVSTAWGDGSTASGFRSTAWGDGATASGISSTAWGLDAEATEQLATVWGRNTRASGLRSTAWGFNTKANEASSTAWGFNTEASATRSTAWGEGTIASGINSTTFGRNTDASGNESSAWGHSNTASGLHSTAWGDGSTASGSRSTAWGRQNTANGSYSSVSGLQNSALSFGETVLGIGATTYTVSTNGAGLFRTPNAADRLFVIGNAIDANNNNVVDNAERSDAIVVLKNGNTGIGSSTPAERLHVEGNIRMVDGNQAVGNILVSDVNGTATWTSPGSLAGVGGTLDDSYDSGGAGNGNTVIADNGPLQVDGTDGVVSTGTLNIGTTMPLGAGVRMVWNPNRAAMRFGEVSGTQWNTTNVGEHSAAWGENTIASGNGSSAWGSTTLASGLNSTAWGTASVAPGTSGTAWGFSTQANFSNCTAWGESTKANGTNATAWGDGTEASGNRSTAWGWDATAAGVNATAWGRVTNATGASSTVWGDEAAASGFAATAWGNNTLGSAIYSTAFGDGSIAAGNYATTWGFQTIATNTGATAWGRNNQATGFYATSSGVMNEARSYAETVIGVGAEPLSLSTNGSSAFRSGNSTDGLFVIGNAIDANNNGLVENSERSNALVVLKNGRAGLGTNTPDRHVEVEGSGQQFIRATSTNGGNVGVEFKRQGNTFDDWQIRNQTGLLFFSQSSNDLSSVTDVLRLGRSTVSPATNNTTSCGAPTLRWTSVHATNGTIQTSDERTKQDIVGLNYGLNEVLALRPVSYNWKYDPAQHKIGLIAQEVQELIPEVIHVGDDEEALLGLNYAELVPVLIKAVQEQQEQIEELKALLEKKVDLENLSVQHETHVPR